jgi:hypothetical protein
MAERQAMQEAKSNLVSTVSVYRTHLRFLIVKKTLSARANYVA